jgi:hypothetical protein
MAFTNTPTINRQIAKINLPVTGLLKVTPLPCFTGSGSGVWNASSFQYRQYPFKCVFTYCQIVKKIKRQSKIKEKGSKGE